MSEIDQVRAKLYILAARAAKVRGAVEDMSLGEAMRLVPGHREPDRHLTNLELLLTEVADQLGTMNQAQLRREGAA